MIFKKIEVTDTKQLYTEYSEVVSPAPGKSSMVTRSETGTHRIHNDMASAMDALTGHMALICDMKCGDVINPKVFQKTRHVIAGLKVKSVIISGVDEDMRVQLVGEQVLPFGILNNKSPKVEVSHNNQYEFGTILLKDLDMIISEARAYVQDLKQDKEQMALDLDHDGDLDGPVQPTKK